MKKLELLLVPLASVSFLTNCNTNKSEEWKSVDKVGDVYTRINDINTNFKFSDNLTINLKDKHIIGGQELDKPGPYLQFSLSKKYFKINIPIDLPKTKYSYCLFSNSDFYTLGYSFDQKGMHKSAEKFKGGEQKFFEYIKPYLFPLETVKTLLTNVESFIEKGKTDSRYGGSYSFYVLDQDTFSLKGTINAFGPESDKSTKITKSDCSLNIVNGKFVEWSIINTDKDNDTKINQQQIMMFDYDTVVTKDPEANPDTWHD